MRLGNRFAYPAFIRALTGAVALAITGANRFKKLKKRFWDRRPYSRVVTSHRAFRNMQAYIRINILEGNGWGRNEAEYLVRTNSA